LLTPTPDLTFLAVAPRLTVEHAPTIVDGTFNI
jgi:hypothetical protein